MGSVTLTIAATAIAASAALPPSFSTCRPTRAASGWLEATIPWGARVAARRALNGSMVTFPVAAFEAILFYRNWITIA